MSIDCVTEEKPATSQTAAWSARFSEPITVPNGIVLETLRDAGAYISRLPDPVYRMESWRAATHLLIEAAEGAAPIELARFAIIVALIPQQ